MRHANPALQSFLIQPAKQLLSLAFAMGACAVAAPATRAIADEAPSTQPAVAPAQNPADSKIVVLPFGVVGGQAGDTWMGMSIQQSLVTDLMTASASQVVTASDTPADAAAAAEAGRKLGARYAVFGDVHVNDAAARVTGQIIATDTGRAVSALKATGATNNLFPMEDTLGEQARRAVNGIIAEGGLVANPRTAAVPPQQPAPPPTLDVNGPLRTTPDLAQSTTPPYTNGWYDGGYSLQPSFSYGGYGYDPYPYYYYRYPTYIYGGSGIGGGFGRHYGGARGSYSRGGFSGGAHNNAGAGRSGGGGRSGGRR